MVDRCVYPKKHYFDEILRYLYEKQVFLQRCHIFVSIQGWRGPTIETRGFAFDKKKETRDFASDLTARGLQTGDGNELTIEAMRNSQSLDLWRELPSGQTGCADCRLMGCLPVFATRTVKGYLIVTNGCLQQHYW
uniref:Uncharacterized protein n=1 Tax=Arabidopsis halleri subsp. halleri TaxID=81971 RepID=K4UF85_ARAHH|nr:uncharacterized protein [Arabidopsis halleri subsp. halleri]